MAPTSIAWHRTAINRSEPSRPIRLALEDGLINHETSKKPQSHFSASVIVCRVFTTARRTGRHPRQADWLLFIEIHLNLSPRYTRELYRRRFGVETSYRCFGQVWGWTTAKNPAYRFVLIALAFVLLNVWIHLRWIMSQRTPRGYYALFLRIEGSDSRHAKNAAKL
jgi:hypothetical protein